MTSASTWTLPVAMFPFIQKTYLTFPGAHKDKAPFSSANARDFGADVRMQRLK